MEQIELIKNSLKTRQGGQHMSRETAIKTTLERDRREYEEMGIEVPDILNGKRLKYFREWNGELRYIQNIKMRKISAKDKEQCESKASQMDVRDKRVELGETDVKSKTESLEDETKTENVVGQQVLSQVMETG
ncbi:translation machinery-associated protein 16-like [Lingula anatina]|uniref:Translation machinery-associated protein 16-like n=1 Tax=Lingula anatina TaxID=7574 RepID=A0A1S3HKP5_LINAN|nr:translation machinery-associated protein 16-like [Lingula anatina]|eukprot:XP_013385579.1 translation machinery-associated protein 16-like [Lingula anatina]